jgi:ubiquinone/menaquinone biosynthesis C-methylase UbiE
MGLCPNYQKAIEEMIRVVKLNGVVIFLNQIPGNPRKHYSLVNSPEELNEMLNNCKKHTVIFNDF